MKNMFVKGELSPVSNAVEYLGKRKTHNSAFDSDGALFTMTVIISKQWRG